MSHRGDPREGLELDTEVREECGIIGVYAPGEEVARIAFFGIYALQHRGQESAGFASAHRGSLRIKTAMGLVSQGLDEDDIGLLPGHAAIGHTRYSTTGSSRFRNAQPIRSVGPNGEIALAHNGNVVNAVELRQELKEWGCRFETSSDSEIIAHLLTNTAGSDWGERIAGVMRRLRGAYSLAVLTEDAVIGIRDPLGVRPLCIGKLDSGWVLASETCALDHIGATFLREVNPGEAVVIDSGGPRTVYMRESQNGCSSCIFEHIYFARPDSVIDGKLIYSQRVEMGAELAREHPVDADMVIGIPDSAIAGRRGLFA